MSLVEVDGQFTSLSVQSLLSQSSFQIPIINDIITVEVGTIGSMVFDKHSDILYVSNGIMWLGACFTGNTGLGNSMWRYFTDPETLHTTVQLEPTNSSYSQLTDFVFPNTGCNFSSGPIRFFFDTTSSAFRAGSTTGTQWDLDNLGTNSVAFGINTISNGDASTVSGGDNNVNTGNYSTISGGSNNSTQNEYSTISGGVANVINEDGVASSIGGGNSNTISNSSGGIIGGGISNTLSGNRNVISGGYNNTINGENSNNLGNVISGGQRNLIDTSNDSTIGGGSDNRCMADYCVVSGGLNNHSTAYLATIGGGTNNTVSGAGSTIPGGQSNTSSGSNSFVCGMAANDNGKNNVFVWSDATGFTVPSNSPSNSVWWAVGSNSSGSTGVYTILTDSTRTNGVSVASGSNTWSSVSDRNLKTNIVEMNYQDTLLKIRELPIYSYNFIGKDSGIIYRGPMAQDWNRLFISDKNPLTIDSIDLDGVALSCVKGLLEIVQDLQQQNEDQEIRIQKLESIIQELQK